MKQKILKLFLGVAVFWAVTQGAQTLQAAEITDTVGEEIIQYIEEVQYVEKLQYYGTGSDLMTYEEAVEFLKEQVSAKEENITITISRETYDTYGADGLLDAILEHTEASKGYEGDAIIYDGGYTAGMSIKYNDSQAVITYEMTYKLTKEQEEATRQAVTEALSGLKLTGKTESQKVELIYNYICDNVDYDYGGTYGELTYTSYSAAINKKAVCQGYAVLFYRMCKEAGLDVRIVTGTGNGGAHAWNIIRIGDEYYNVDCTWDGQDEETNHNYFLKNEIDFESHVREAAFTTDEFVKKYPMTDVSWLDYAVLGTKWEHENVDTQNLTTIDDNVVTNAADGKAKILLFYSAGSSTAQKFLEDIAKYDFSDVDIVAIEIGEADKATVQEFSSKIETDQVTFCYDTTGAAAYLYLDYSSLQEGANLVPAAVYIDQDNKVQYMKWGIDSIGGTREICNVLFGDVELSDIQLDMNKGSSSMLEVLVNGEERNPQLFKWTSSDSNVATVDENGKVTAVSEGTASITCTAGESIKLQAVVEVGVHVHELDEGTITKEPTCKSKGIRTYHCILCDTYSETEEIPMTEHKEVIDAAVEATCSSTGKTQGSHCEYCDLVLVAQTDTPMAAHTENQGTITKVASCTEKGCITYNCKWCGKFMRKEEIATTPHGIVTDSAVKATYTSFGKTEGSHCKYCGEVLVEQEITPALEGLAKDAKGTWYYYKNAKIDTSRNSLVKYNNSWWYVVNGKLDFCYTGLCKFNGSWWYVKSGKLDFGYTGLAKHSGSWWYMKNGKLDFGYTGLCKYSGSWWYVKSGKFDFSYTGLCKYSGSWWYVKSGKLDFSYKGLCKYNGSWWYVKSGKLDFSYTGLALYGNNWWYVKSSKLDFGFTGTVKYAGFNWNVKKGIMTGRA